MGASSKKHGITGIKHRRPKSNVNVRARKTRLNAKKKTLFAEILGALRGVKESE